MSDTLHVHIVYTMCMLTDYAVLPFPTLQGMACGAECTRHMYVALSSGSYV